MLSTGLESYEAYHICIIGIFVPPSAENTKNRQERVVPYAESTGVLYASYLKHRRQLSRERGGLFLSESKRNKGQPISI